MDSPDVSAHEPARYLSLPIRISATRTETALRCYRRHVIPDILRLTGETSISLWFGTIFHEAAATWWRSLYFDEVPRQEAYGAAREALLGNWDPPEDPSKRPYHTQEMAQEALDGYMKNADVAAGVPGDWQLVAVETRMEIPLEIPGGPGDEPIPAIFPFTMDRILREPNEDILLNVDTKTSGWTPWLWKKAMSRSLQQKAYMWAGSMGLPEPLEMSYTEGVWKRGDVGSVVNHWASEGWTQAQLQEAGQMVIRTAYQDYLFARTVALGCGLPDVPLYEDIREDTDLCQKLWDTACALAVSPGTSYNPHDCDSYGRPCPYVQMCDGPPRDRLGLLLSDYEKGGPWDIWGIQGDDDA